MIGPNHSPSAILVAFYSVSGFSSVVLLITNKTLCLSFPMPLFTVLFQNLCALLCTILIVAVSPGFIKRFRLCHMFPSLPGSFLFVIALWLSNTSLGYTSLPVFVVANNLRPMSTALIEYGAFGTRVSLVRVCGLFAIAIGAIITASSVGNRELKGLGIAGIYTMIVSLLNVVDGEFMKSVKGEQTPAGINLYRLIVSIPLFLFLIPFSSEELRFAQVDLRSVILLIVSGVTCTFAGVSLFELQSRTSPTSIQVANVAFKFLTTIISLFTHGEWPSVGGWTGYAVSSLGVLVYSTDFRWQRLASKLD